MLGVVVSIMVLNHYYSLFTPPADASSKRPGGAAIAISICKGVDYMSSPGEAQIVRAESLLQTLQLHNSTVPRILIVSGFNSSEYTNLAEGFTKVVNVPIGDLGFKIRKQGDGLTPLSNNLQDRQDGNCTSLKFWTWYLVDYDAVLHTDTDVCFEENPDPYIEKFANKSDQQFQAFCEDAGRGWTGFNVHLMMIRPYTIIGELLRLKAKHGDFTGFTNTDQDVIESLMSPSSQCQGVSWPKHQHSKWCWQ
jgi:hypothetical protein